MSGCRGGSTVAIHPIVLVVLNRGVAELQGSNHTHARAKTRAVAVSHPPCHCSASAFKDGATRKKVHSINRSRRRTSEPNRMFACCESTEQSFPHCREASNITIGNGSQISSSCLRTSVLAPRELPMPTTELTDAELPSPPPSSHHHVSLPA